MIWRGWYEILMNDNSCRSSPNTYATFSAYFCSNQDANKLIIEIIPTVDHTKKLFCEFLKALFLTETETSFIQTNTIWFASLFWAPVLNASSSAPAFTSNFNLKPWNFPDATRRDWAIFVALPPGFEWRKTNSFILPIKRSWLEEPNLRGGGGEDDRSLMKGS